MAEEDAVDIEHENNNRFEEYEWCGQKRIRATTLLEGGFRGTCSQRIGSVVVRAGGWSSALSRGNCCWLGSFVTRLPACEAHIKWMCLGGEMEL